MSFESASSKDNNENPKQIPISQLNTDENKDILNYPYENKEIESVCNNFIENLFLTNPKNYESFGQNNYNIKRISEIKVDLNKDKSPQNYSLESTPIISPQKQENNKQENTSTLNEKDKENNINNIIRKRKSKDESDKENNSLLSNSQNNQSNSSNINTERMNEICHDFIDDIFSQENAKYARNRANGDELNIMRSENTKSYKKSEITNSPDNKQNTEQKLDKSGFKVTPELVKNLMEHKKEIITIQKNWKTYYDVNRFKLLKYKTLIIQNFYRKYLINKYNLPSNFYYNDKFLKMQTELYEDTYKKNLNILFPSLFMDKSDLNEFASNMLEMANNPVHNPYDTGKIFLFAKILDFDMMIDTNECYETLWASIYDSIYTKCLQNNDPIQLISLGSQHTICVTNKGKVYTFGWNNYGQCGVPINSTVVLKSELENNRLININKFNELELRILNRIDGVKIPQIDETILSNSITCGEDYTLIVDQEGKLWSFGLNLNGQLGLGHTDQTDRPSEVLLDNNSDRTIQKNNNQSINNK